MKDESVSALLESGEIQMTEDVIFMLDTVIAMFERGMESEQFISYAMQLLEVWRVPLANNDGQVELADGVIEKIMGKTA